MGWKNCDTCSASFGDCDRPNLNTSCDECLRWRRMIRRRLDSQLEFFDQCKHFVYGWVELAREPDPTLTDHEYIRSYAKLLDEGVIFYVGRGGRKRLSDSKDRNPEAVWKRSHLSLWRSFGFQLLGGFEREAEAKEFEEDLIKLYDPLHNLQWWNQ